MPRTNKRRSADDPVEQPVTPKRRRRRIVWDHRRDKYLLLAIFAHMKVKTPNFQEIADILGNETYSADTLTRRFRVLRQMATEVMEDRHDKGLEVLEEETTERDRDVIIVDEPAVPNLAPQPPITPSSIRSERAAAEPTSPISENPIPSQRQRNAKETPIPAAHRLIPKVQCHQKETNRNLAVNRSLIVLAKTVPKAVSQLYLLPTATD
ncbi:uncharacterized protein APUU_11759A [Aspergillus puulaauensis]|uniref:Uncharacterized protein n=1 Tax=Aspergillus puulaauensis TaxID=1220207 RepID=A0A7R7XCK1_9EURO|nr:uncharacterized protein APUU_11759A [Aspergillus puulaauensis]BCS18931.1 hypothetical protein APUU_11759A [Aspergillus puulaauensis]